MIETIKVIITKMINKCELDEWTISRSSFTFSKNNHVSLTWLYSLTAQSLPLCVAPIKSTTESLAKSGDRFSRLSIGALAGIITSVCVVGVVLIAAISVTVSIQSWVSHWFQVKVGIINWISENYISLEMFHILPWKRFPSYSTCCLLLIGSRIP